MAGDMLRIEPSEALGGACKILATSLGVRVNGPPTRTPAAIKMGVPPGVGGYVWADFHFRGTLYRVWSGPDKVVRVGAIRSGYENPQPLHEPFRTKVLRQGREELAAVLEALDERLNSHEGTGRFVAEATPDSPPED